MREMYVGGVGSLPAYRGYEVTSYQEEAVAGSILGSTQMALGAFVRVKQATGAGQPIAGTLDFTAPAGFSLGVSGTGGEFVYESIDGSGNLFTAFGNLHSPVLARPQWVLLTVRQYDVAGQTTSDLYANGALIATATAPASGMTVLGAHPFRIGFNSTFNDVAEACDIGPVAYLGGPVTEELFLLGTDLAMKRRTFVADSINGINWSDIWVPRVGEGSNDCSYFTRTGLTNLNEVGSALARTSPAALYV